MIIYFIHQILLQ